MNHSTQSAILDKIEALHEKYGAEEKDILPYLDGLIHSGFLHYWDYVNLDVLLNLQKPRTAFQDEMIFITYHQISELFFKLILLEMGQITGGNESSGEALGSRMHRINSYYKLLIRCFSTLTDGIDPEQFRQFRLALFPASGLQSIQYRLIELNATDMHNLVSEELREGTAAGEDVDGLYHKLYWRSASVANNQLSITMRNFDAKYASLIVSKARELKDKNLNAFLRRNMEKIAGDNTLLDAFREFDTLANVNWKLAHFRCAVKYFKSIPHDVPSTGHTDWKKYLQPKFQKIIFFPDLWSRESRENWGTVSLPL